MEIKPLKDDIASAERYIMAKGIILFIGTMQKDLDGLTIGNYLFDLDEVLLFVYEKQSTIILSFLHLFFLFFLLLLIR